jgi:hypothetical protein
MFLWLLETLVGALLLLWVFRNLSMLLDRLEKKPLTTTQLPASDQPEVKYGAQLGGVLFVLCLIGAAMFDKTLSALHALILFIGLPLLGGVIQHCRERVQPLAEGHPWRVLAESLAHRAGVGPVQVRLVLSTSPYPLVRGNIIELPTRAVRHFSEAELRFLVGLALWALQNGHSQHDANGAFSDEADRFALALTGDPGAAQSALLGLHQQQDLGHYQPLDRTEHRIERLISWWQRHLLTATGQAMPPVQQVGRP